MRPLSPEDVSKCVDFMLENRRYSDRDVALFILQCKLGFRIKEMLSITIGDVAEDGELRDTITIQRRNLKGGKKQNSRVSSRTVPIPSSCKAPLQQYITKLLGVGYTAGDPLFPSSTTNRALRPDSVCRAMKRMAKALHIDRVNTHSCRKTFAKHIYKACNNDIMETKAALGHANVATTQNYLSFGLGQQFQAVMRSD
jgi:integrase